MKPSSSNSRSKGHAKRVEKREELDQEARDRKRQKKTSWSCAGQPRKLVVTPRQAAKARTHKDPLLA